tara:strand:+ start:133 stop:471 length:339 start_codon:yes stop_codon:yes gene_type:complete
MTEVKKKKLADRRTLLSNRLIESLKPKNVRYSIGDSEVIGLRIFVFEGGQKTRQIRLDNGERPRAYMLPPMYDAEAADPESAKNYWINNLREKTDTELGVIYNSKGTIKPFF